MRGRLQIIAPKPVTKLRGPATYHSRDKKMLCQAARSVQAVVNAHTAQALPAPPSLVPLAALVPPLPPPSLVPLVALAPPLPPPPLVALAPEPVALAPPPLMPPTPGKDAAARVQQPPDVAPRTRYFFCKVL